MKKTRALLSLALVLSLLAGMFAVGSISVSADETAWDYAHTMSQTYEWWTLENDFAAYQFEKPTATAQVGAIGGPFNPNADDPADANNRDYWATSYHGGYNNGVLKATTYTGWSVLTYKVEAMKDFELEFTVTGSYGRMGIMFGGKLGVIPFSRDNDNTNDTGVAIGIESAKHLAVAGAVDGDAWVAAGNTLGTHGDFTQMVQAYKQVSTTNTNVVTSEALTADDLNTFHVKVQNGVCTVWAVGEESQKMEVPLSENYKGGYISFFSASNQCGLWSFKIKKLSDAEEPDWDYAHTMTARQETWSLDPYFRAYTFAKPVVDSSPVATGGPFVPSVLDTYNGTPTRAYWTTTNWGNYTKGWLRPTNCSGWAVLTYTAQQYENFELEFSVAPSYSRQGIIISDKGDLGFTRDSNTANDTGIVIGYESGHTLVVGGALDATASVATGTCSESTHGDYSGTALVSKKFSGTYLNNVTASEEEQENYTYHVKVDSGILTAWVDGKESEKMTVTLTDAYKSGYISYYTATNAQGGLISFKVKEVAVQADNTVVIDAENDLVKVKVGAGYQVAPGSLLVKDGDNTYAPVRVGFQSEENTQSAQYQVLNADGTAMDLTDAMVGEATFVADADATAKGAMGFLGTSVNTEKGGLRFVHRMNITSDAEGSYITANNTKQKIKDYGILVAAQAVLQNPDDLDIATANASMHIAQFYYLDGTGYDPNALGDAFKTDQYYDISDSYVDISMMVTGITDAIDDYVFITRTYVVLEGGEVVYGDAKTSSYAAA